MERRMPGRRTLSRSRKEFPFLVALAASILLVSSFPTSRAATTYVIGPSVSGVAQTCAVLGGAWDGTTTCTLYQDIDLSQGDVLEIESGATVEISLNITVAVSGAVVVRAGGNLFNSGVTMISSQGSIDNNGTFANVASGMISNSGKIIGYALRGSILNEASIVNRPAGTIAVYSGPSSTYSGAYFSNYGSLDNEGALVSFGNLTNLEGGSLNNSGSISLSSISEGEPSSAAPVTLNEGTFVNSMGGSLTEKGGALDNNGSFTNGGNLSEDAFSTFHNSGSVMNLGTFESSAAFYNLDGTFTNSGTFDDLGDCAVAPCGIFSNSGTILNELGATLENQGNITNSNQAGQSTLAGNLTNLGTLANSGDISNGPDGSITNEGNLTNSGTLSNSLLVDNHGYIDSSGVILNGGEIINERGGTLVNSNIILNSGDIQNAGTLNQSCGELQDVGRGAVYGNAVVVSSCAVTATNAPEFPAGAVAALTLFALASVAFGVRLRGGSSGTRRQPSIR